MLAHWKYLQMNEGIRDEKRNYRNVYYAPYRTTGELVYHVNSSQHSQSQVAGAAICSLSSAVNPSFQQYSNGSLSLYTVTTCIWGQTETILVVMDYVHCPLPCT